MQNQNLKKSTNRRCISTRAISPFCTFALLLLCTSLCGCALLDVAEFLTPQGPPSYKQISRSYYQTKLKTSGSADVLAMIYLPESDLGRRFAGTQLLSQSKSVVASVGQKKKGYKTWFNMVAFHENEMTARRKYLFVVDEKTKIVFVGPRSSVKFDCEMVLESEVLDKPYANANARRIAILRQVLKNVRKDIDELSHDNENLGICGMLINQALETVLVKLDISPGLAVRLNDKSGVEFEHISFDKGKIHMAVADDIVTVKMRLGSLVKKLIGNEM